MRSTWFFLVTSCFGLVASSEQIIMDAPQYQQPSGPSLADILTVERSLSIFYSYARETKFGKLLDDPAENITILAPTNKAVIALPRKPHQGPSDGNLEKMPHILQADYDALSRGNVENWVGAHIIPMSISLTNEEESYETMLAGTSMKFSVRHPSRDGWSQYVMNGDIEFVGRQEASNGVLYLIDGTTLY